MEIASTFKCLLLTGDFSTLLDVTFDRINFYKLSLLDQLRRSHSTPRIVAIYP
jgi:hypothetical protein